MRINSLFLELQESIIPKLPEISGLVDIVLSFLSFEWGDFHIISGAL